MPERPKRRKNKNKRKGTKNVNTDNSKSNAEKSEALDGSCSYVTDNVPIENEEDVENKTSFEISNCLNNSEKSDIAENILDDNKLISESNYMQISSSVSEQSEELNKEILTSDGDILTSKTGTLNNDNAKKNGEQSENNIPRFELLLNNVNNIKTQSETMHTYIVETPEQVTNTKTKCKLDKTKKSKSCDNDECPSIVEITEDDSALHENNCRNTIHNSNVIVSGEESDIEWEKVNHFNLPETQLIKGVLSSDTIPHNIVHCDEVQSLSPQEELSLRNYLQTLNLSTSPSNSNTEDIKTEIEEIINREIKYRLRKKGLTEDTGFIRTGPCRSLAVIDEEGSGDSSKTSRRESYLSDKKSDNEELEDDVFECKPINRSNTNLIMYNSNKRLIPQPCIRVDAIIKEPEVSEARGDWSMKTVEKMTGAEVVYLTDSSSSTSSIYDLNDDVDKGEETDVSIRMITPTIEVTDTESLLSNTFLSKSNEKHLNKNGKNTCKSAALAEDDKFEKINAEVINFTFEKDPHEIIILNADDIKTDLFVKDINEPLSVESEALCKGNILKVENRSENPSILPPKSQIDTCDLEIKVIKCELNNAINNLIKEVISESENNKESSETFTRQDSSSSLDSSQCTAKYNPTHSSLNDMSNILQEDTSDNTNKENLQIGIASSHVNDVLQYVTSKAPFITEKIQDEYSNQPSKLKDICVKKITSFPFGDKILEELANVSLRLHNMSILASERIEVKNQIYNDSKIDVNQYKLREPLEHDISGRVSNNFPPPILPRKSSLKIAQDEPVKFVTSKREAKYECLSPSQKMLMEKTNTTTERDYKSQPNVNTIYNESSNSNEKKIMNPSNIPSSIAPMKSETGSRLLALLRETSFSNNLNSLQLEDKNLDQISKVKHNSETFSKRLLDKIDSSHSPNYYTRELTTNNKTYSSVSPSTVKPLPPPKPKKLSTYFYESDEGSDFRGNSFRSMRSNKKYFHYSTGNLNKEIEDDISSIQNMHRYCSNLRNQNYDSGPRRPSLPKDLCEQQMEYIRRKEKEVDAELRRLELEQKSSNRNRGPRAPMMADNKSNYNQTVDSQTKAYTNKDNTAMSQTHKNIINNKLSSLFSSSQEELLRDKMYSEYVTQMAEREQRKQHKVIKITQTPVNCNLISKSMPLLDDYDSKINNPIEQEFITKARERWCKLGICDPETEDENVVGRDIYTEPKVIEHKIKVIEGGKEKDVKKLPSHMQEFVKFTVKDKEQDIGSTGESNADKASAHVVVFCAVIILVLTVGKFLLQLLRNK